MRLDPARESWMRAKETRAVMQALTVAGAQARFVGGAVRNALLRSDVEDIDIATPLVPDEVMRRLSSAHINALPTGIEHGTVTAVVEGKPFEITTLRRDVATDGRRATVAFSDDWAEDAARRDFTINALYASLDGEVFDYTGGLGDLGARRVRFIGSPAERIREDYLRILRLFRFHAWYGKGEIDAQALAAAAAARANLQRLSGERIRKELLRLVEAEDPLLSLRRMAETGILAELVPAGANLDRLGHLVAIDSGNFFVPDPVLRLAALLPSDVGAVAAVGERLRLSNQDRDRLLVLAERHKTLSPRMAVRKARALLYRFGKETFRDRVLLDWSEDSERSNAVAWRALLAVADAWERPHFPLSGRDVMAAGVPEGPQVGRVLAEMEEWWIESDFTDDTSALAEKLEAAARSPAK